MTIDYRAIDPLREQLATRKPDSPQFSQPGNEGIEVSEYADATPDELNTLLRSVRFDTDKANDHQWSVAFSDYSGLLQQNGATRYSISKKSELADIAADIDPKIKASDF